MYIFRKKAALSLWLSQLESGRSIGFVPTMGALHEGHMSLITSAKQNCDCVVASVFVNPTQFNNTEDLDKYPRDPAQDIEMLTKAGCDALYLPEVADVYDSKEDFAFDLGNIGQVFEGPLRPGHFSGVVNVCKRLFDLVRPTDVFFGQKDFQQCAVIQKMLLHYQLKINFHRCPIVREPDGLAMSSRNVRLDPESRLLAPTLFRIMSEMTASAHQYAPESLTERIQNQLKKYPEFVVDYVALVDTSDLNPIYQWNRESVLLVTVILGKVRLLDNIILPAT